MTRATTKRSRYDNEIFSQYENCVMIMVDMLSDFDIRLLLPNPCAFQPSRSPHHHYHSSQNATTHAHCTPYHLPVMFPRLEVSSLLPPAPMSRYYTKENKLASLSTASSLLNATMRGAKVRKERICERDIPRIRLPRIRHRPQQQTPTEPIEPNPFPTLALVLLIWGDAP